MDSRDEKILKEFEKMKSQFALVGVDTRINRSGYPGDYRYTVMAQFPTIIIGEHEFAGLVTKIYFNSRGNVNVNFSHYIEAAQVGDDSLPHGSCLGRNRYELEDHLKQGQYMDFATTLMAALGRVDHDAGMRSHILKCPTCEKWNDQGEFYDYCHKCQKRFCGKCLITSACSFCRTEPGYSCCPDCRDDPGLTPVLVDDREYLACDSCIARLQQQEDLFYCPACMRLSTYTNCSGCGGAMCGRCSSGYFCESPWHVDDVDRVIDAVENRGISISIARGYSSLGSRDHFCDQCVISTTGHPIRSKLGARIVCANHSHDSEHMKKCSNESCRYGWLPLEYFHKDATAADGLRSECKFCRSRRRQERRREQNETNDNSESTIAGATKPGAAREDEIITIAEVPF